MTRKNKFVKGAKIEDWEHLARVLKRNEWVYWDNRPKHPGWLRPMQFQVLDQALARGILSEAVDKRLYVCVHAQDCGDRHAAAGCTAYEPHAFQKYTCDSLGTCRWAGVAQWCVPAREEPCSQQD